MSAHFFNLSSGKLPQLTRAKLRICKFLNKRGFYLSVLFVEYLSEYISENCLYGKSLYSLSTPLGRNFAGMSAPQVFRIILKEHRVKLLSEAVYVEILK